jgi:molybdate transport system substrate-binding protein
MRGRRWAIAVVCLTFVAAACGSNSGGSSGAGDTTKLTVFAASSLTGAFTQIGKDFEAAHAGTKVVFDFGSSGDLEPQIESEGTADVFASASETYMDTLGQNVGVSDRADFVQNQLVIITPPDDPAHVGSLSDLAKPGVQVILAAAGVPVGDYARQALQTAGIQQAVLANVVSNEEDDASLVAKITAGEADAAIVYASDVTSQVASQVHAVPLPPKDNVIATYPIAVVTGSAQADLAKTFVDYVTGSAGQATLATYGFLPPPAP